MFVIWLIVGVNLALLWEQRKALTIPRQWKISLILWTIFLSIGAISTLQSPFPLTSFFGQDQMGDGWLYWLLIAAFTFAERQILQNPWRYCSDAIIAVGIMTVTRPLDWSKPTIAQIMSSRSPMWTLSARGIKKRPLFGWGFDGFGIAYPYIRNPQVTPIVVNLDEFTYDYINIEGEISTREIPTYKAHNWILDTTLSVGIFGLVAGIALWVYYVCLALNYSRGGIESVAIAYLIFTFSWFDGAQYAHIVWWMMSFAGVESAYLTRFSRWRSQSEQLAITSLTFPASTANNSARSASYTP